MLQAADRGQVRKIVGGWRQDGHSIALVPTMGNLHRGHLALVDAACQRADRVVTSIYVNPTQFGEGEDYENYPRTLDQDLKSLETAGCDLAFVPTQSIVYPFGIEQSVKFVAPAKLASALEGASRPGHFDGVLSVVLRLFNLITPDMAIFGEKDYQQLLLIQQMVKDLSLPVTVSSIPTVREENGLALSSRNNYLEPAQRDAAASLSLVMSGVVAELQQDPGLWRQAEKSARERLERLGFKVDYVAIRQSSDLQEPSEKAGDLRVLAAAWSGHVRLIDNMKII